jgi:hypothetical protein
MGRSKVGRFEIYCFRHTALTWLSPCCDAFTVDRIAGHSSITITQRCRHRQSDEVGWVIAKMTAGHIGNPSPRNLIGDLAVTETLDNSQSIF